MICKVLLMNGIRCVWLSLVCWMILQGGTTWGASPQISLDSPSGAPGGELTLVVSLETNDTSLSAVIFDLTFSTNYLSSEPPILGGALSDHIVVSSLPSPGVRRVQISSFSGAPLSSGVLVYLPFMIATNAPDHDESVSLTKLPDPVVASPGGGVLAITPRPGFSSISRTDDGVVHLQMSGSGNRNYVIETTTNFSSPQWTSIETNSPVNGTHVFDDTATGESPARFYRVTLVR